MTQTVSYLQETTFSVMNKIGISFLVTYKPRPLWSVWQESWYLLSFTNCVLHHVFNFKATWLKVGQIFTCIMVWPPAKAGGSPPQTKLRLIIPHMFQEGLEGFVTFIFEVSGETGQAPHAGLERLREQGSGTWGEAGISTTVPSTWSGACGIWNSCWHRRSPDVG